MKWKYVDTELYAMRITLALSLLLLSIAPPLHAQLGAKRNGFTRADTLRGTINPDRAWWDVLHYDVTVKPDFASRSIQGRTSIIFQAVADGQRMQIDLQQPLVVDSIVAEITTKTERGGSFSTPKLSYKREGNIIMVDLPAPIASGTAMPIHIHYHGIPRAAKNPPWDGGWIWKKDPKGNPWMSVACQGLGASVWYPCKDHQSDEPQSAALHIIAPDSLVGVGNGRFQNNTANGDGTTTWHWSVSAPINTYNLVPYIGKYVNFREQYEGVEGPLDLDYWVLEHNRTKARAHFMQVPTMMACFEDWLGPYPFYKDGYKLVEAPHLGMEHQSAIAYGNNYVNGYMGQDLSGTGHGLDWDYIIVHESGHEWYANSISTADIADMWVHEGFTMYTEALYVECQYGKEAAEDYVVGIRRNIRNDRPVIGPYGVNEEGSGDMYPKGANLVHMVRNILGNDVRFKEMLREMNRRYYHSIVTSAEIEAFMDTYTDHDLRPMFDQYLRSRKVPTLEWGVAKNKLYVRFENSIDGFHMPVRLFVDGQDVGLHVVRSDWQVLPVKVGGKSAVSVDRNWYVNSQPASKIALKELSKGVR